MKSYRLPLVVTQPNTKPLLSDMCSGAVDRSRTVCRCLPPATRDATREVSRQIQVIQWSQIASSSERLTVRTRLTMDVCVSRAVDRSETVFGCLGRVVEYPRRVLYVHMHLWSGRPLRGRLWVSISRGSRGNVGRAPCMAARAKSFCGPMPGITEARRSYPDVRLHLRSGRPLRDSVWISSLGGRVSTTGTLRPHVPSERATAQR